jgi:RNA polymerase sigma-70 factor (ECF subfamily)
MFRPPGSLSNKLVKNEERWSACFDGIRAKNAQSLAVLYDETSGILYSLALRMVNNTADAEEVVLDVYQQVWRTAERFDSSRGTVLGWLIVLTRSRAIDRLRRSSGRLSHEIHIDEKREMRSKGPLPEGQSIFEQERKLIRRALETLAPEQRTAIELAFFGGLSHAQVAQELDAPLGTIKTRIRSGMRKLREALAPVISLGGNA